jgi:HK97 family phage prohead protease
MTIAKAFSTLTIKRVDEGKRILTGVATTPSVDRVGDVVEPDGVEYTLPLPFLYGHDAKKPIGHVTKASVSSRGIDVTVKLASTDEPGPVKDRLDSAWQDIRLGLVRGLSIGFKGLETSYDRVTGGMRFLKWRWLELSAVTIPANADARISTVKAANKLYVDGYGLSIDKRRLYRPHFMLGL